LKNDLPVQHDVGYLINMCHHLKKIVSCDYDTKEFVDKFTEIFDREIVQPYNEKIKREMDYVNRQVTDVFVKMERSFYNPKKSLKKKKKKSLKKKKSMRSPP